MLNYEGETLRRSESAVGTAKTYRKLITEEAESAEESSRVLAHTRASFFHDLHIRSQRRGSVFALPCDARFGHNYRS
jgi:hypothetical protein